MNHKPKYLNLSAVARACGLNRSAVRQAAERGHIRTKRRSVPAFIVTYSLEDAKRHVARTGGKIGRPGK